VPTNVVQVAEKRYQSSVYRAYVAVCIMASE